MPNRGDSAPFVQKRADDADGSFVLTKVFDGRAIGDDEEIEVGWIHIIHALVGFDAVAVRPDDGMQVRRGQLSFDPFLPQTVPRQEQRQILESVGDEKECGHGARLRTGMIS